MLQIGLLEKKNP